MAVTNNGEKSMATEDTAGAAGEPREDEAEHGGAKPLGYKSPGPRDVPAEPGFFAIYKKGQGYWTRICTAGAAVALIALTAHFLYRQLPALIPPLAEQRNALVGIVAGFALACGLLVWHLMNKPSNADFLIATDSEMKKVNWTSRKELVGSTKVVIFFMIIIAATLFVIDVTMGYVFYALRVLKAPPF